MRNVDVGSKVLSSVVCMRTVDKASLSAGSIDAWWRNINYFGIHILKKILFTHVESQNHIILQVVNLSVPLFIIFNAL